jgi:hypothetical protein
MVVFLADEPIDDTRRNANRDQDSAGGTKKHAPTSFTIPVKAC